MRKHFESFSAEWTSVIGWTRVSLNDGNALRSGNLQSVRCLWESGVSVSLSLLPAFFAFSSAFFLLRLLPICRLTYRQFSSFRSLDKFVSKVSLYELWNKNRNRDQMSPLFFYYLSTFSDWKIVNHSNCITL